METFFPKSFLFGLVFEIFDSSLERGKTFEKKKEKRNIEVKNENSNKNRN